MKRSTLAFAAAITVLAALMYSAASAEDKAMMKHEPVSRAYLHHYNLPSSGVALEGYCPVAYFAVNKPVMGKKEFASDYNGVTYYLDPRERRCEKSVSDENPDSRKFLPAYGGWCATGMREHDKFPVDPRNFKIVDGNPKTLLIPNCKLFIKLKWKAWSPKHVVELITFNHPRSTLEPTNKSLRSAIRPHREQLSGGLIKRMQLAKSSTLEATVGKYPVTRTSEIRLGTKT